MCDLMTGPSFPSSAFSAEPGTNGTVVTGEVVIGEQGRGTST